MCICTLYDILTNIYIYIYKYEHNCNQMTMYIYTHIGAQI